MNTQYLLTTFFGALAMLLTSSAVGEVQIGVLTCSSVPGSRTNLLIRSTTDVTCEFKDTAGNVERYKGETGIALGLDLSFKEKETFGFSVVSTSEVGAGNHALAGKYIGGQASATAGVGLGAAALVGGNDDNFGLNPLALSTSDGVGAATGIGFLYIEADK